MVNAIIAGAAGRMGKRLISMIHDSDGITLTGAFEHPDNPCVNQDAGQTAGLGEIGIKIAGSIDDVIDLGDVVIDFTVPESTIQNIRSASSRPKIVSAPLPPKIVSRPLPASMVSFPSSP